MDDLYQHLLNDFQQDFPLTARPYQQIAEELGVSEATVLQVLQTLSDQQLINRIGPIFRPNQIGKSMLVAMSIPPKHLQRVAAIVNQFPEVNHNYERENRFNLWFVLVGENDEHVQRTLDAIENQSGYRTMRLPLLTDYFINLGFAMELDDGCN